MKSFREYINLVEGQLNDGWSPLSGNDVAQACHILRIDPAPFQSGNAGQMVYVFANQGKPMMIATLDRSNMNDIKVFARLQDDTPAQGWKSQIDGLVTKATSAVEAPHWSFA